MVSQVKEDLSRGRGVGVKARAGTVPGEREGSASTRVLSLGHTLPRHLGTGTLIKEAGEGPLRGRLSIAKVGEQPVLTVPIPFRHGGLLILGSTSLTYSRAGL